MVLLELGRNVQVISGKPERSLQTIRPQVSKRVDARQTCAIREVKSRHGIIEPSVLMHLREIGEGYALEGPRKGVSINYRLLEHGKQSLDRMTLCAPGGQRLGIIGKQAREALAREAMFIPLILQCS